jgi:hypothetical protein
MRKIVVILLAAADKESQRTKRHLVRVKKFIDQANQP